LGWWVYQRRHGGFQSATLTYSDTGRLIGLPTGWRVRFRTVPDGLRALAFFCLVIGLARPQGGDAREVLRGRGIDLVFALDISGSMAALDFEPANRLEAAKAVIGEFLEGRTFDRVGVVAFARDSYSLVPLTLDYDVLRELLGRVKLVTQLTDPAGQQIFFDGTNAGAGLAAAEAMMRSSPTQTKVIVLLTDGANNAGLDPVMAAEAVNILKVRVYTIGMGKTGDVPFPDGTGGVILVQSDLDEPTLIAMADAADGAYFRAEDTDSLRRVITQIDRLERSPVQRQTVVPWRDMAWDWLWAALGFMLSERLLRATVWDGAI
jgi:Ca-activated chloride channel family protein